jgi:hypothetical protein
VLYGIFRYLYLLYRRQLGGNPSELFLSDRALLVNTFLWVLAVLRHHLPSAPVTTAMLGRLGTLSAARCQVCFARSAVGAVAETLAAKAAPTFIARGLGRSYGDALAQRRTAA